MTHLKIIQNNTLADTEEVSQEIIQKLYDLAINGDLDQTSGLKGRLHLTAGYRAQAEYLHQMFPNLIISIDNYIIPFEDPNMVAYLNSIGVGSNGVVTEADAAAATVAANSLNTTITKFNELKYFTNITQSRGGISGNSDGWVKFLLWTALEEVDISNFTSIGHASDSGGGDTFNGCSSLKKVTASDKLETIGRNAFYSDANLETITGLDGVITFYKQAFKWCGKLKGSNFTNVEALFISGEHSVFYGCTALTSITLSSLNTVIPQSCFYDCTNLTTVNLNNVTTIGDGAFYNCSSLTSVNLSNVTRIDTKAFEKSGLTGNISLPSITSIEDRVFCDSKITSLDFTGSSITAIPGYLCWSVSTLTNVTLPASCTEINTYAFRGCSALTTINLSNVITFHNQCFENCTSLTTINLSNASVIPYASFKSSGLSGSLTLSNVTQLGGSSLAGTNLTSVDFTGSTFTKVPGSLFIFCSSLDHVIFPSTVVETESWIFYNCRNLRYAVFPTTSTITWNNDTFSNCPSTCTIYVDDSKVSEVTTALSGKFNGQIKGISEMPSA